MPIAATTNEKAAPLGVVWGALISGLGLFGAWQPAAFVILAVIVVAGVAFGFRFTGQARRAFFAVGLVLGLPGVTVGTLVLILSLLSGKPS